MRDMDAVPESSGAIVSSAIYRKFIVMPIRSITRGISSSWETVVGLFVHSIPSNSSLVGSVPACKVAALLWREYRSSKLHDKKQIPLGGVILQSALYSGKTALIGGLLLGPQDPYDNGSDIGFIEVCFRPSLLGDE